MAGCFTLYLIAFNPSAISRCDHDIFESSGICVNTATRMVHSWVLYANETLAASNIGLVVTYLHNAISRRKYIYSKVSLIEVGVISNFFFPILLFGLC